MSYEAFTSMPVIIAALAAWALGVAGTWGWNRLRDWRQARMIGFSLSEFRWCAARRFDPEAREKAALVRSVLAKFSEFKAAGCLSPGSVVLSASSYAALCESVASEDDQSDRARRPQFESEVSESGVPDPSIGSTMDRHRFIEPVETAIHVQNIQQKSPERAVSEARSPERFTRLFLAPREQVSEFLSAEVARHGAGCGVGREIRRDQNAWCEAFRDWTATNAIGPLLPDCMFLKELNRVAFITKSRPRRKDDFGRVLKTPGGSPERDTVYVLSLSAYEAAERAKRRQEAKRSADRASAVMGIAA